MLLDYHREYRTAPSGSIAELRVQPDGRAESVGGEPGQPCSSGEARFRLEPTELIRVRSLLAQAAGALRGAADEPKPEAPDLRIVTSDSTAHFHTVGGAPPEVRRLVA